jgi:lysozyme
MPTAPTSAAALCSLFLLMACSAPAPSASDDAELLGQGSAALEPPSAGFEEDAVRQCALGPTVKGIDVSYYQGGIDWPEVARAGVGFAFTRVADGSEIVDTQLARNWVEMKRSGVVRGAYHFFRPAQDPAVQAQVMIGELQKYGGLGPGDLPPVLDIEVMDGVEPKRVLANMQVWLDRVEAAFGKTPILYTSPGFWEELGAPASFGRYPLWLANWDARCPRKPDTWQRWSFWQSSDRGTIAGIEGPVDLDRWNGSREELLAFAAGGSPKVEAPRTAEPPRAKKGSAKVDVPKKKPNRQVPSRTRATRVLGDLLAATVGRGFPRIVVPR